MRRLLPLLVLAITLVVHSDEPVKKEGPPAKSKGQVVEFPKLEDLDPELRKKAEALIAQLGAESFKDRRKAREALKAMEPAIISLLERHAGDKEPEIRETLPEIIKSLRIKLNITIPDLKLTLVMIGPSSFMTGSPATEKDREEEETQHKVTLTQAFWMGRTEVTQSQYESVMGNNPSEFKGANNPVEQVSWNDCVEFCKKLTAQEQKAGRLPADQEYRLPTEAEWEYCCRAGTKTKYSFGNDESNLGDYAWYTSNSGRKTHAVAGKKPNAWGLYDMHGNVWEWCQDRYGNYPSGAQIDPAGPTTGSNRVNRGGSWDSFARRCRSAHRNRNPPSYWNYRLGFRFVRAQVR